MRIRKTFEEVECFLFQGEEGFMLGSPGFTYDVASYFLVKNTHKENICSVNMIFLNKTLKLNPPSIDMVFLNKPLS